ncbi:MAG: penicillin-binding protein 1A [Burkholderiaceae bacterium]|jgi:penicillin-binding protein 1A|nr:penicillin-binding protein 1A [Burkholderiaceae bacterium]
MSTRKPGSNDARRRTDADRPRWLRWTGKLFGWSAALIAAALLGAAFAGGVALAIAYPNLPDVSADLLNYRPKLPLRVFTSEGTLIGEFGEERRNLTPIKDIPQVMQNAVLAIEDARFYHHSGVDYVGLARAALANLRNFRSQGASTITMQVARNVYLSSEKTYTRKIYEVLLTFKLEHLLTKDQILEIYMNQIYLGNRAYGFAAASEVYFGKPLKDITVAEAAMLAGLPKAPSTFNPFANPERARTRQLYIIERMQKFDFITAEQAEAARKEPLRLHPRNEDTGIHAEYVAEMARQMIADQYGDQAYSRGLNVYTTLHAADQEAAYDALRQGLLNFDRRRAWRGPEKFVNLSNGQDAQSEADDIDTILGDIPDSGDLLSAVVLEADPHRVLVQRPGGARIAIAGNGLRQTQAGLSPKAPPATRIRRGAVVRVVRSADNEWSITQIPEVEGALVALDPRNGAIRALVGGFDFDANKFNHVIQAWRQPGSGFKPFIYSAALEKGFSPTTVVDDAPLFFDASITGSQPWEPKNFGGDFEGPMPLKTGLAKSKNLVSIRVLQAITPQYAQDWITRFGFDAQRHPPYLTMALGAGAVTPMQMACAFAVFANGGYRVNPYLITRVTDSSGKILVDTAPPDPTQAGRAIDARNAFVMDTMLNDVARIGTAARAQATLKRPDLYGKTGTTNDALDAWFTGFQPTLVTSVWMGYDTPRTLGARETGGGLSLPIWIDFMKTALKGVPVAALKSPEGVTRVGGDWYYDEYASGGGITHLDDAGLVPTDEFADAPPRPAGERNRILDMFKN